MTAGADDTWTFTTEGLTGTVEWKPLLDDSQWALGPNYPAQTCAAARFGGALPPPGRRAAWLAAILLCSQMSAGEAMKIDE